MSFYLKTGTLSVSTSDSGTISVTGLGFTPKLVVFLGNTKSGSAHGGACIGAMTSTDQWCFRENRFDTASNRWNVHSQTKALYFRTYGTDGGSGEYTFSSFDADGFTLTVVSAVQLDTVIGFMAFGGHEFECAIGTGEWPTSNSVNEVVSGLPFKPNALIVTQHIGAVANEALSSTGAGITLGFATGPTQQFGGSFVKKDGEINIDGSLADTIINPWLDVWAADPNWRDFTFLKFNADGWTIDPSGTGTAAGDYGWIAMHTPSIYAGQDNLRTGTGTFDVYAPFRPSGMLVFATPDVTANSSSKTVGVHGILGLTDGVTSHGGTVLDARGFTDFKVQNYSDALMKGFQRDGADSFSVNSIVTFDSWLDNGVRLNQTDAAPNAGKFAYLLIGAPPPASGAKAAQPFWSKT